MGKGLQQLKNLFNDYGGYVTRQLVDEAGLEPKLLTYLVSIGDIERVQWGVYRWSTAPLKNHEDLLEVALRIPYSIVCLSSALAFHGLTTFMPKKIHLAVPQKRKPPQLGYPPLKFHYFSQNTYGFGIEEYDISGHGLKVYSIEKTLVDLLRLREQAHFAEGLRHYMTKKANLPELFKAARVGRVEKRLRPIVETMAYDTAH